MPNPRLVTICLAAASLAALAGPAPAAPPVAAAASGAAAAAAAAAAEAPPPQVVLLRAEVDAAGKVRAARPLDDKALPALVAAAQEIAPKLQFTPASKDGRAVASETTLVLTLALEPRPGGNFGISLRRAVNGPSVVKVGHARKLQVGRDNGALVVASVEQRADGSVDIATCKAERVELRVASSMAEKMFTKTACDTLDETRFLPDKVDGVEVAARLSVPFEFNGGPKKPSRDRKPAGARISSVDEGKVPPIVAVSSIAGVVLPRVDYTAPAK